MFEFIDVLFALIAGVVFTILMLVLGVPMDIWLTNLILIMIIMLTVGVVYKAYIKKIIFKNKNENSEEDQKTEEIKEDEETEKSNKDTISNKVMTEFDDEDDLD